MKSEGKLWAQPCWECKIGCACFYSRSPRWSHELVVKNHFINIYLAHLAWGMLSNRIFITVSINHTALWIFQWIFSVSMSVLPVMFHLHTSPKCVITIQSIGVSVNANMQLPLFLQELRHTFFQPIIWQKKNSFMKFRGLLDMFLIMWYKVSVIFIKRWPSVWLIRTLSFFLQLLRIPKHLQCFQSVTEPLEDQSKPRLARSLQQASLWKSRNLQVRWVVNLSDGGPQAARVVFLFW